MFNPTTTPNARQFAAVLPPRCLQAGRLKAMRPARPSLPEPTAEAGQQVIEDLGKLVARGGLETTRQDHPIIVYILMLSRHSMVGMVGRNGVGDWHEKQQRRYRASSD